MATLPFGGGMGSDSLINPGDLTLNTSTQQFVLGARATIGPRSFRYVKAGGTSLVQGKLQQAPAENTAFQDMAPAAAAIGATSVTLTPGASTATANQYADGWLVVTITPGEGYMYQISSHAAISSSTAFVANLKDAIQVALTTASNVDMVSNPYANVIINPTTASSAPVGAAVFPVTNAQFGWIQDGGVASLLVDDQTITVGTNVAASNQAAGAIEPHTGVQALVGVAMTGGATTEYVAVKLFL